MSKSPDAFRTISEVAEWLDTPAHVLRFWESRFRQVKPVKRAGGRRYYRPADMALLGGIKRLLHDDGMTIKGVQKILRDKGVKHVADLSMAVDADIEQSDIDAAEARLMASITPEAATDTTNDVAPAPVTTSPEPETPSEPVVAAAATETPVVAAPDVVVDTAPVEPNPVIADAPVDQTPPAPDAPVVDDPAAAPTSEQVAPDPVQLDLLSDPTPTVEVIEEPKAPVASVITPNPVNTHDIPASTPTTPVPIIVDVPEDPDEDTLVVTGNDVETPTARLMAADAQNFAGQTKALQALYDRITGADGNIAEGV